MWGRRPGKVRKTLRLTQAKLDRAKRILGTETDIEQALDLVAFRDEAFEGVRRWITERSARSARSELATCLRNA